MKSIAIIPARGGSKRIPRKNIKDFLGKPIIAYSIQAALESALFDEVMVSTDDEEIAEIAIKHGAKVPFFRSKENADDFATTVDVLIEVISEYQSRFEVTFDALCCIYPTAPLLTALRLTQSYSLMKDLGATSAIPVVQYGYPPQRAFLIKDGQLSYANQRYEKTRSQDLVPQFHDAGQFYWILPKEMIKNRSLVSDKCIPLILSEIETQDIDTKVDWKLAELKFKLIST